MKGAITHLHLTVSELVTAEDYWISFVQHEHFLDDIELLEGNRTLPKESSLKFHPKTKLLRVGRRLEISKHSYSRIASHNFPWKSSYHLSPMIGR